MTAVASAPADAGTAPPGTGITAGESPRGRDLWLRWRAMCAVAALVLTGGIMIALFQPATAPAGYLDPGNPGATGARALATILTERGHPVARVSTVAAADAAASGDDSTLVVTQPGLLTPGQLAGLARVPGDLMLVEPDSASLAALAPGVSLAGEAPVRPAGPACGMPAALLAGNADMGGLLLRTTRPPQQQCYPSGGRPTLVRYAAAGRTVTILGTGAPLTNQDLASLGNGALAINLLSSRAHVVWLVPGPAPAAGSGQTPFTDLVPWPAYLITIQLAVAAVLTALWRSRRLGPLVTERLPAVVRAAETVEGHGRLYRARRSRDRAAAALRGAAESRLAHRLGLADGTDGSGLGGHSAPWGHPRPRWPSTPRAAALCALLAARTGRGQDAVTAIMFGPVPQDDAALVRLADALDTLEKEVRTP